MMKKMRLAVMVALLATVTALNAQDLSFALKGGANMSNFYGKDTKSLKMKLGYHVGLAADYEFAPNMAIQSGLFFTTKGAKLPSLETTSKFGDVTATNSVKGSINAMYLQIPLHFAYKVNVAPDTRIVFHAGPYAAYGVGGKTKAEASVKLSGTLPDAQKAAYDAHVKALNSGLAKEANVFSKDGAYKAFDAGVGVGVGAEFGPFLVDLGWDMGLLNIAKAKGSNVKTQNAYLSVGYKF